ncbi:proline racemase family protein [Radiobacillus kanasensis]|uniref:proline racemase family protein n=1 Tax=Radiobacillus kanasensis TaxID=2844358 RepID=UPI001E580756|nr:proline racemase family protein [Radiobacillus kanasensis]UFT98821.1 proline racemase family protein [Radiobacillus kanasensis]
MKLDKLVTTIDTHTGGNPTRTILSGAPKLVGNTMSDRMLYMKKHYDWFRQVLMNEPRGHDIMSGAILQEPCHPEADIGVIYIETGGYLPMCGHDTIGFCTALIESGLIEYEEPLTVLTLDTPAGLVTVDIEIENGKAKTVSFKNVPSFFYKKVDVDVDGIGKVTVEIGYGGNFYGIVSADKINLSLQKSNASEIIEKAIAIRREVNRNIEVVHPENAFIKGLTHIEFYTSPEHPEAHVKNTVVVPPGGIDRSPCGTGTSAKMSILFAKGELGLNEEFIHESIVGSIFRGYITEVTNVSDFPATINYIGGSAWVTGHHQFLLDYDDPQWKGFLLIPEMEEH